MKKQWLSGILVGSLFVYLFLGTGCENFTASMGSFLKDYTELAAVDNHTVSARSTNDKDGILSLSSADDAIINLVLRNPQLYALDVLVSVPDLQELTPAEAYNASLAPGKSNVTLILKKEFLAKLDGGNDISPVITLRDPGSARIFEPYTITLRSNTPPQRVEGVAVMLDRNSGTEGARPYVLCFNLPSLEGIHSDIKKISINGAVFAFPEDLPNRYTPQGMAQAGEADLQANSSTGVVFQAGTHPVRYKTAVVQSVNETIFTIVLTDEKGLSSTVTASSKTSYLKLIDITKTNDSGPIALNEDIPQDSNEETASITLTAPAKDTLGNDLDASDLKVHYKITRNGIEGAVQSASSPITLALEPGAYTITAYSSKPGLVSSNAVTRTFSVKASNFYVSAIGDDVTGSGISTNPYKTIAKALTHCTEAGLYTIVVKGTIAEAVDLSAKNNMTITLKGIDSNAQISGTPSGRTINCGSSASLTLSIENLTISGGNSDNGAGIYSGLNNLTIKNCTIKNNTATGKGGGVYVAGGTCTIEGTTKIESNTAANGGGVYVAGGTFTMSGSATVGSNNDVYLPSGMFITIADALSSDLAAKITPEATADGTVVLNGSGYTLTQADCNKFSFAPLPPLAGKKVVLINGMGVIGTASNVGLPFDPASAKNYAIKLDSASVVSAGGTVKLAIYERNGSTIGAYIPYSSTRVTAATITLYQGGIATGFTASALGGYPALVLPVWLGVGQYQIHLRAVIDGIVISGMQDIEIQSPVGAVGAVSAIAALTTDGTIKVGGSMTPAQLTDIANAVRAKTGIKIALDLSEVTGLTTVGVRTFHPAQALSAIRLPPTVTRIDQQAFYGCSNLAAIDMPGVVTLGFSAFRETALVEVVLPASLITIDDANPFGNCEKLIEIDCSLVPSKFVFEEGVLYNADKTKLVAAVQPRAGYSIPPTVTSIGSMAFSGKNITSITIPSTVVSIGFNVFDGCSQLVSAKFEGNLTNLGDTFINCTKLENVTLPDGFTTISSNMFRFCTSLAAITVPGSVTTIDNYAFMDCTSLAAVTVNSNSLPTLVGEKAFDCKRPGGTTLNFLHITQPAGWNSSTSNWNVDSFPANWNAGWKGTSIVNVRWQP